MKREIETAREVRRRLEIVCNRLEHPTPESMDATAGELNAAIRLLSELESVLKSVGFLPGRMPALAQEMSGIRRGVSRAQALLAAAGKFIEAWARLLGAEDTSVNYTPTGVSGPVLAVDRGKVVLHG